MTEDIRLEKIVCRLAGAQSIGKHTGYISEVCEIFRDRFTLSVPYFVDQQGNYDALVKIAGGIPESALLSHPRKEKRKLTRADVEQKVKQYFRIANRFGIEIEEITLDTNQSGEKEGREIKVFEARGVVYRKGDRGTEFNSVHPKNLSAYRNLP